MKMILVELNRPVLINNSICEQIRLQPLYGFLSPNYGDDKDKNDELDDQIFTYVCYLAAIHEWSSFGDVEFTVLNDDCWLDRDGKRHSVYDNWSFDVARKCRERIGLDYTLHEIDLDEVSGACFDCGRDRSLITCSSLMDHLVRLAEEQQKKENQYGVLLFNRPIWLPRGEFWSGEDGFCHIFGLILKPEEMAGEYLEYLGYLAMCEEYYLTGVTPSGFAPIIDDPSRWNNGTDCFVKGKEVLEECEVCRKKHNLKLHTAVVTLPEKVILDGVRDDMIISQQLYESLIVTVANAKDESGCPK